MMSLEEIVKHVEQVAYNNNDEALVCMGIKEYRELAGLLRELQERRKAPEIITCGECRWYGRANKQRFYRGMDCLQRRMSTVVPDKDFCSKAERAERRTE